MSHATKEGGKFDNARVARGAHIGKVMTVHASAMRTAACVVEGEDYRLQRAC
jgi:hypothetical protein